MIPTLIAQVGAIANTAGCTPCECGNQLACITEKFPVSVQFLIWPVLYLFVNLIPFFTVLVPALITRTLLIKFFKKLNPMLIRIIAVLSGSIFILPFVLSYLSPNTLTTLRTPVLSSIAIAGVYTLISLIDRKSKNISWSNFFSGLIVVLSIVIAVLYGFKTKKVSQYNQIIQERRENTLGVVRALNLASFAEEVKESLKTKDYQEIEKRINPNKNLELYYMDYIGTKYTKDKFHSMYNTTEFLETPIYSNVAGTIVTVEDLFTFASNMLSNENVLDIYLDNQLAVDQNKSLDAYTNAIFIYKHGYENVTLTFDKEPDAKWYLSRIGYYLPRSNSE